MTPLRNIEAEQALLGAILFDNHTLHRLPDGIKAEHFSEPVHGALYGEIVRRVRSERLADAVSLAEWWAALPAAAELGGPKYLLILLDHAARLSAQAVEYGELVLDLAQRRALRAVYEDGLEALSSKGAAEALLETERRLAEVAAQDDSADQFEHLGCLAEQAVLAAEHGELEGISTGLPSLDAKLGGLKRGAVYVIGGAASMGKSIVGKAISDAIARQGFGVGNFDLEMDKTDIGLRAASSAAYRPSEAVYAGAPGGDGNPHYLSARRRTLSQRQWERMREGAGALASLPVYVDARAGLTLAQIEARARKLKRRLQRQGVDLAALVIDHEGLIASDTRTGTELDRARERAQGALALAKRLNVILIALAQLTKDGARQEGDVRLPTKDDLNYGSEWDRAAEAVILLHRKAYYAERKPQHLRTDADCDALGARDATLIVDKSRGGSRGQVEILMDVATAWVGEAPPKPKLERVV